MITDTLSGLLRIQHGYVSEKALGKANNVFLEELLSLTSNAFIEMTELARIMNY